MDIQANLRNKASKRKKLKSEPQVLQRFLVRLLRSSQVHPLPSWRHPLSSCLCQNRLADFARCQCMLLGPAAAVPGGGQTDQTLLPAPGWHGLLQRAPLRVPCLLPSCWP